MIKTAAGKYDGSEKKIDIILSFALPWLRTNNDDCWDKVVNASGARIISKKSTISLNAYLLSESSLFVWNDRILLITCGETKLINALPEILSIVKKSDIALIKYERKNYMFSEKQTSVFKEDAAYIAEYFPGNSYRLGLQSDYNVDIFYSSDTKFSKKHCATFQLFMFDLEPHSTKIFCSDNVKSGRQIGKLSGLDKIYPGMITDSHLFSPYGYSLNAISGMYYYTVHVTPQPEVSCASFETNIVEKNYSGLINKIISIFKPDKFTLVITTDAAGQNIKQFKTIPVKTIPDAAAGYSVIENVRYEFDCNRISTYLGVRAGKPMFRK